MDASATTVFLFDVDNTLFNNDKLKEDLSAALQRIGGRAAHDEYWEHYEALREQHGYADFLGAVQAMRKPGLNDLWLPDVARFLLEYRFDQGVYDGARDALAHVSRTGPAVILSDGDSVFQPHKIWRAGLGDAVRGRVMIYLHKEKVLDQVEAEHPARHYVMVDDKLRLLAAMKKIWGERLTTVFVRQGHYGLDDKANAEHAPADITIDAIGHLVNHKLDH